MNASVAKKNNWGNNLKNERFRKSLQFGESMVSVVELLQHSILGKKRLIDEMSSILLRFLFLMVVFGSLQCSTAGCKFEHNLYQFLRRNILMFSCGDVFSFAFHRKRTQTLHLHVRIV